MAATTWTGLTDSIGLFGAYTLLVNKNPRRNNIRRTMNREGFRVVTELFDTLIGAAAGGAALATHSRVAPETPGIGLGGLRPLEVITDINRVSTAADITLLKEMVFGVVTRPSYVADLSKNGGPAFT